MLQFREEVEMRPIELPDLTPEAHQELEELYRKTHDIRVRTRAQMILLAAEKRMVAAEIAEIVRENEQTVRRWLKRWSLFYQNDDWGTSGDYQPSFPTKWMSKDGLTMLMVYSGSFDDYNLALQKITIKLKGVSNDQQK